MPGQPRFIPRGVCDSVGNNHERFGYPSIESHRLLKESRVMTWEIKAALFTAVLLALMAIVWISDTAAYLCGRRWGR